MNERKLPLESDSEAHLGRPVREVVDDVEGGAVDHSPVWNRDGWTLTWPIWHLLPIQERRQLAHDHGYKTIGEFEEYMSLHRAMDDSEALPSKPYPNEQAYPMVEPPIEEAKSDVPEAAVDDEEEDEDSDNNESQALENEAAAVELSPQELMNLGGQILMIHDEILHRIFEWLPVDAYATLARVSPHWKHLTRTEAVYRRLCERLYLNQSKRRQLHVSRFGGSYRTMLEQRPRVRAFGGVYVLKYSHVKQIQRDMWTEVSSVDVP